MKSQQLLWTCVLLLAVGCTAHTVPVPGSNLEILFDRAIPPPATEAWMAYASSRVHWIRYGFFEQNPGVPAYQHTFAEEVEARNTCAQVWSEIKAQRGGSDRYLDDLVLVQEAGFLSEYTWVYLRDTGWTAPGNLRLTEFDHWRQLFLREHTPETRVVLRFREH